jgi:hypothetical protein
MKRFLLLIASSIAITSASHAVTSPPLSLQQADALEQLRVSDIHSGDLELIESSLDHLTSEHLADILRFMPDPSAIAGTRWFDVSPYTSWDEYNFFRPIGDTVITLLARRDLFLDPARQLNNPALTNMSPQALAALAFAQAYVEEKWDQEPPWDGDIVNTTFNWIHPQTLEPRDLATFLNGDDFEQLRVEYWWATYASLPLDIAHLFGWGKGSDFTESLRGMSPPESNAPRLAGYAYPVGNQLYLQTAETWYWYAAYLEVGDQRYGAFEPATLDTSLLLPAFVTDADIAAADAAAALAHPNRVVPSGLWALYTAPFARDLRVELVNPETAAFWNVMRFVWAGARQREGGGTPDTPGNGQPPLFALRYDLRSPLLNGRAVKDISAFALLTTVYSDSILLDFTNWSGESNTLIVNPLDPNRPDGTHRMVSERNKAIFVIEQMGDETLYANATHITGSRGLGLSFTPAYAGQAGADFLPYTVEEVQFLTSALVTETRDYQLGASQQTLCNSPLLKSSYDHYSSAQEHITVTWDALVGDLCR